MAKIFKLFKAIGLVLRDPGLLNLIIESRSRYKAKVIRSYNKPYGLPQVALTDLLPGFNVTVDPYAFLEGSSPPMDLALLKSLAVKHKVKNYLEIGTWRGESAANIASVAENVYTINLPDKDMLLSGSSPEYIASHCYFSKNLANITHIRAHSHEFDFQSINKKFDMVFIDGDHHYNAVKKDTETAFKIIKNDESIIVWHDYAISPESVRWEVMLGILDGSPPEKRNKIFHVSNSLCAVYLNELFETKDLIPYSLPDNKFRVRVEISGTGKG